MSRDINTHRRALADIARILHWLRRRSPRGATSWRNALWRTFFRIMEDAEGFPMADESPHLGRPVRQALFKTRMGRRYRIIFEFTDTAVRILRIRRPGQRPLRKRDLLEE